jgi:hypothetical protein
MTHVLVGQVKTLPAGWAGKRVIVQRRHDWNAPRTHERRQIKRQIQQVMHVHNLGLNGAKDVVNLRTDKRRTICVDERGTPPVVHDLDNREAFVNAPRDMTMRTRRIVLGTENRHVMASRERPGQFERVDLGARSVAREKVVDRVKDSLRAMSHGADKLNDT